MKYSLRGKNKEILFTQKNFVAKGGEGSIYRVGNTIYKIYEDPSRMIPEAKIDELTKIQDSNVIKPIDIILDPRNKVVGFTMKYVSGEALCKLFTNDFRNRNNISDDQILELVENIKKTTFTIHDSRCLIVDGNELNYLVDDKKFVTPYFIDVNSWQTPNFPATAIMPSIRDWKSKKFSNLTDWFSFAIVSFQLFVGIHPFKGKIKGYKKNDFQQRVVDCVSVLNSKVRVPAVVRDFDIIPKHYRDWYYNLFEKGDRTTPPSQAGIRGPIETRHIVISSTDTFDIKELREFDSEIVYHTRRNGIEITKTRKSIYFKNQQHRVSSDVEVVMTPKMQIPVFVKVKDGEAQFHCPDKNIMELGNVHFSCDEKMIIDDTIYLKNRENLSEIRFFEMGKNKVFPVVQKTWGIMPNSSEFFSGVIYQNIFSNVYLTFLKPNPPGSSQFQITPVPELNDYKVVGAKYENEICVVIGHKDNQYDRFVFLFDEANYVYRVAKDCDLYLPNFTVLDNGISIMITDEGKIEIFKRKSAAVKEILDKEIDTAMKLTKAGTEARFFKGNKLFSIRMKK